MRVPEQMCLHGDRRRVISTLGIIGCFSFNTFLLQEKYVLQWWESIVRQHTMS